MLTDEDRRVLAHRYDIADDALDAIAREGDVAGVLVGWLADAERHRDLEADPALPRLLAELALRRAYDRRVQVAGPEWSW